MLFKKRYLKKDLLLNISRVFFNVPIKKGAEDGDAHNAEGQDVEDVSQEHLPFIVEAVLTLLITDGSQRRDY